MPPLAGLKDLAGRGTTDMSLLTELSNPPTAIICQRTIAFLKNAAAILAGDVQIP
jgi:hypothetical protein